MTFFHQAIIAFGVLFCGIGVHAQEEPPSDQANQSSLTVHPNRFELRGNAARQQLIVLQGSGALARDLTRACSFRSETPQIARISSSGLVAPVTDGSAVLVVEAAGQQHRVRVQVRAAGESLPVDFEQDVVPIFSRAGCNAGACHGKQGGQKGFQLSLLGFNPQFDYDALAKEARGRRIFFAEPKRSLLLLKPTGMLPHGGGLRMPFGGPQYDALMRWIAAGMPRRQPGTPRLVDVSVLPSDRIMANTEQQQLLVTARYSNGSTRDVTRLAAFQSNEIAFATVDEKGLITAGSITGEAAVMARYRGMIVVCNVAVPLSTVVAADHYARLPRHNAIDGHVWNKLQRLRITPSRAAPDHKFLRRAYVDLIGRVPSIDEARDFLTDASSNKREALIGRLLQQPELAEHWANKWADLLRPNAYRVGIKAVLNYDHWIRDSFRKNKPYDQFVRELLTAQGSTFRDGAVTYFRDRRSPDELTTITSQLFLGIRLECAKCHHHPFEVWGMDDFYSFAAYFSQIGRKGKGLSPPISGSEEIFFDAKKGSVTHPLTGEVMKPRPLFGVAPEISEDRDIRESLAAWITSDTNPFFVQVLANRLWADLMGRGLVEPVDDMRATNPPSNAELLTHLGEEFRNHGYDLKELLRHIATSYVYGLSSLPSDTNVVDTRNYSRHFRQRLRAEVLLDSVCQITGVAEDFDAMPRGSRAKEIWTHRIGSLFLDAFGRPDPNQDPPCERSGDSTVVQTLHLMNSQNLYEKVTHESGLAAGLAASQKTIQQITEELYLAAYARFPDSDELQIAHRIFQNTGGDRRRATEDLLWALLNTPEFIIKD